MKFENRRCGPLIRIGLRTAWLVLVALHTLCAGPQPASAAEQLNLGMISDSPARTIKKFAPLLDYLRNKGLPMGQVINARSLDEMIELLKNKKVDFVFESSNSAIRMMDEAGAIPILIREKDGIREYNSVIFVNKNSPVKKMTDLLGKIVVFQDPESTSSYFLPRNLLAGAGLDLIEANEPVPGKVAYYFSRSDPNVLAHVKLGKADAGGTSSEAVAHLPQFRILQPRVGLRAPARGAGAGRRRLRRAEEGALELGKGSGRFRRADHRGNAHRLLGIRGRPSGGHEPRQGHARPMTRPRPLAASGTKARRRAALLARWKA